MAPRRVAERERVVVREAAEREPVVRDLVPLLARHFTSLASDAKSRVGEEAGDAHRTPSAELTRSVPGHSSALRRRTGAMDARTRWPTRACHPERAKRVEGSPSHMPVSPLVSLDRERDHARNESRPSRLFRERRRLEL